MTVTGWDRILIALGAIAGLAGVALSAAAAHVTGAGSLETAARFLLFHAPALLAHGVRLGRAALEELRPVGERRADRLRAGDDGFLLRLAQEPLHRGDELRREQCEIESIIPTTSTLEDVFVKAVEGASEERPEPTSA